jgi:hypothetical protein
MRASLNFNLPDDDGEFHAALSGISRMRQGLSHKNFTLTDAEREAIIHGQAALDQVGTEWTLKCAATLRGLLERLK